MIMMPHIAPLPLPLRWMWSGKLYTTQTMLSSGENFKMANFGWVLSIFAPSLLPLLLPAVASLFPVSCQLLLPLPPLPPAPVPRSPSGTVVLSWCYRGTIVVPAWYRIDPARRGEAGGEVGNNGIRP